MNMHVPTLHPYGIPAGIDPRSWRQAVEARINDLLDQSMALITALDTAGDLELDTVDDEDGGDSEPEETDCNLAGASSDLEHDEGDGDCDLIIPGGMEDEI